MVQVLARTSSLCLNFSNVTAAKKVFKTWTIIGANSHFRKAFIMPDYKHGIVPVTRRSLKTRLYVYGLACRLLSVICHRNGAFRKRSSNPPEEFENALLSFSCGPEMFWKRSFSQAMRWRWSCEFTELVFLKHKSKRPEIIPSLKFSENIWCVFRVNHPFSNSSGVVWTVA